MDNVEIKKSIDSFEEDDFVESKEILQKEIGKTVDTFLKTKLGMKQDKED